MSWVSKFKWGSFFGQIALGILGGGGGVTIGTALGGPIGGLIGGAIGSAITSGVSHMTASPLPAAPLTTEQAAQVGQAILNTPVVPISQSLGSVVMAGSAPVPFRQTDITTPIPAGVTKAIVVPTTKTVLPPLPTIFQELQPTGEDGAPTDAPPPFSGV